MGSDGGPGSAALVPLDAAGGPGSGSSSSGGGGSGSGSSGAGSSGSGSGGSASSSGAAALDATLSDATPGDATLSDVVPGDATAPLDVQGMPPSDAAPPVAPSCAAGGDGLTNCGQNSESCCTSLAVTGGGFHRTYTNDGTGPTAEADPATVSDFRLDEYDVTVGRFRQFVNAVLPPSGSGWLPAPGSGKHTHLNGGLGLANTAPDSGVSYETGWVGSDDIYVAPTTANLSCDAYATWTASPAGDETRPITCVDWYEAYAFCIWDGGFLPSDAVGLFAAAGGTDQRDYPWGTTDPGTANQYAIFGDAQNGGSCYYPTGTLTTCTGPGNIAPVGTAYLGAGRWGQLDLGVGNTEQCGCSTGRATTTRASTCSQPHRRAQSRAAWQRLPRGERRAARVAGVRHRSAREHRAGGPGGRLPLRAATARRGSGARREHAARRQPGCLHGPELHERRRRAIELRHRRRRLLHDPRGHGRHLLPDVRQRRDRADGGSEPRDHQLFPARQVRRDGRPFQAVP